MGFVAHYENYGSVCTHTRRGYGVCGYGWGLGFSNPRVTHAKPYYQYKISYFQDWHHSNSIDNLKLIIHLKYIIKFQLSMYNVSHHTKQLR